MSYENWKKAQAVHSNGILMLSEDRKYHHDENSYSFEKPAVDLMSPGYKVVELFKSHGGVADGPGLELGCGHGFVSAGLACHSIFPDLIISDASARFVELCRSNIPKEVMDSRAVSFATFNCEDIDLLPDNTFSLITLANTLHHLENYVEIISKIKNKLKSNGAFIFQEPLGDGLTILGLMLQNLFCDRGYHHQTRIRRSSIKMFGAGSEHLSVEESGKVSNFSQFISEVSRRDIPKGHLEDKNLIASHEFFDLGNKLGFQVYAHLNQSLSDLGSLEMDSSGGRFYDFCQGYFGHCLGWDLSMQKKILRLLAPQLSYVEELSKGRGVPPTHGVFCFIKH